MKKQIIIAGLTLLSIYGLAQEKIVTSTSEYKPIKGKKTIEVNFMPSGFSSAPFSISYLRGRYFIADNVAFRLGIGLSFNSSSDPTGSSGTISTTPDLITPPTTNTTVSKTDSYLNIQILPGFERHFSVSERFSPYFGGELVLGITSASSTYTYDYTDSQNELNNASTKIEVSGTQATFINNNGNQYVNVGNFTRRGGINFGLNAVLGADYYVTKRIYFGIEFKYGFGFNSASNSKITQTNTVLYSTTTSTVENKDGISSFALGQSVNSAIRLGFWF